MAIKRLFEVSVRAGEDEDPLSKVLFVLADDESDLRSVGGIDDGSIVEVVEVDARVPTAGPSRVIGWTRRHGPSPAFA